MPYYLYYLTPDPNPGKASDLIDFIQDVGEGFTAKLTDDSDANWDCIEVTDADGDWAFDLERLSVESERGAEELGYFIDELTDVEPAANVQWVAQYLTRVRTIYVFRCTSRFSETAAQEVVNDLLDSFRNDEPYGLTHAEGEGWSNEDGPHITWEFGSSATGLWWMAVRTDDGWDVFQMELGDEEHRRAFKAGEVPAGLIWRHYPD